MDLLSVLVGVFTGAAVTWIATRPIRRKVLVIGPDAAVDMVASLVHVAGGKVKVPLSVLLAVGDTEVTMWDDPVTGQRIVTTQKVGESW